MAEDGEKSAGLVETIVTLIFSFIKEAVNVIFSMGWKILNFSLWIIAAVIILPCVFIANTLYPLWAEWGEDF